MRRLLVFITVSLFVFSCNGSSFSSGKGTEKEQNVENTNEDPSQDPDSTNGSPEAKVSNKVTGVVDGRNYFLSIEPSAAKVAINERITFHVKDINNNNEDISSSLEWNSRDSSILALTNEGTGVFEGKKLGNTVVTASLQDLSVGTDVEVYCVNSVDQGTAVRYSRLVIGVENCKGNNIDANGGDYNDAYINITGTSMDVTYGTVGENENARSYLFSNVDQTLSVSITGGSWGSTSTIYPSASYAIIGVSNCSGKNEKYTLKYDGSDNTRSIQVSKGDKIHISSYFEGPVVKPTEMCKYATTYFTDDYSVGYGIAGGSQIIQ